MFNVKLIASMLVGGAMGWMIEIQIKKDVDVMHIMKYWEQDKSLSTEGPVKSCNSIRDSPMQVFSVICRKIFCTLFSLTGLSLSSPIN